MPRLAAAQMSILAPRGDERSRLIRIHLLQHAEAALRPARPGIEIGAMGEQKIEQLQIGSRDMHCRTLEAEHRLIDHCDEFRARLQQKPHVIDIARFNRGLEQLCRRFGQRLDLSLHLRPAGKAVSPRDHELGIA